MGNDTLNMLIYGQAVLQRKYVAYVEAVTCFISYAFIIEIFERIRLLPRRFSDSRANNNITADTGTRNEHLRFCIFESSCLTILT